MSEPGGAEAYIALVHEGLRRAGDEVQVLASGSRDADVMAGAERIWGTDRVLPQAVLQVVNPIAARRVRAVVAAFRPDVALVGGFAYHLSPSALAALGIPTVMAAMDYKAFCPIGTKLLPDGAVCAVPRGRICWTGGCIPFPHWLRDQVRYALIDRQLARVHVVLTPSRTMHDEFARHGIASRVLRLPVGPRGAQPRRR